MKRQWEICSADEKKIENISKQFNISKLVSRIIINRGLINPKQIEIFLNPKRNNFYDPFLMPDMDKAIDRIEKAIKNKEKTMIYGDYDVDGITSSVIMKRYLEERGLATDIYIPNRLDEGYGLNENAVKDIASKNYTLMITVDCGITGNKEVNLANELGIDVIITDHHETLEIIPDALAVVDAKRNDNKYPFRGLAGVGVTFKTIQAISKRMNLAEETYLKYLDLVCIGTISDIVPLEDENRVIAKLGLKLIEKTKNIGLKELLDNTGYTTIDSNTISFGIAPRINACGRMGHEQTAIKLFLTENKEEAKQLALALNKYNQDRQEIEKNIFNEAINLIDKKDEPCIVIGKENWHHGVIGIVSSKITEMYSKPSILLCYENGLAKGSGRSIKGFDLHKALENCDTYIEQFGGHSMAVGITIKKENVEKFKDEFEKYANDLDISGIVPIILVDSKVDLQEINVENVKQLKILEPFGEENNNPLFQINNLKIASIRALSDGKHLKMILQDDKNKTIDVIGFNLGYLVQEYNIGNKVDVIGNLEVNIYKNVENLQLTLKDIRKSI